MSERVKAYFCAFVRGRNGDQATDEEMAENIQRALEVANAIRTAFPETLDLFVPHEHETIIHQLWRDESVTSDQIIDACCKILEPMPMVVVYRPISGGMRKEIDKAVSCGDKVIVAFDSFDDFQKERIAHGILEAKRCKYAQGD